MYVFPGRGKGYQKGDEYGNPTKHNLGGERWSVVISMPSTQSPNKVPRRMLDIARMISAFRCPTLKAYPRSTQRRFYHKKAMHW